MNSKGSLNKSYSSCDSPKKVRVVKMKSPRSCSSINCGDRAFQFVEEHGKTGVPNYYCESCMNKLQLTHCEKCSGTPKSKSESNNTSENL